MFVPDSFWSTDYFLFQVLFSDYWLLLRFTDHWITGSWLLVTGFSFVLLITGSLDYWLLVTGFSFDLLITDYRSLDYWLLASAFWLLPSAFWLLITGFWSLATGYCLLPSGFWLLVTGFWLLVSDHWSLAFALPRPLSVDLYHDRPTQECANDH